MRPLMPPRRPHLHRQTFKSACLLDCFLWSETFDIPLPLNYLLTATTKNILRTHSGCSQCTAHNPRGTRRRKRALALGIRSVSAIVSREAIYASLFRVCPYLYKYFGVWMISYSEAVFSIGTYHTGQPPMLNVKGKGGKPIHGGGSKWMEKDRKV